jgi:hypothetical protein
MRSNYMKNFFRLISVIALLVVGAFVRGQRPAPLQITSLIARIPIPEDSKDCYGSCTVVKDASTGITSIKDNGAVFNDLTGQLTKMMQVDMNAMNAGGNPTAAMQAQSQANRKPTALNPAVMKELGAAQTASMQARQLIQELSVKLGSVNMPKAASGPNCPEVRQGSYVGPTCACTLEHAIAAERRQVTARDQALQQQSAFLHRYIPQIMDQVAIIDKLESDAKFGEGITDPTMLSLLSSTQRQGMSAFTSVLSIANGIWTDGARQYLYLVNASVNHCGDKPQ